MAKFDLPAFLKRVEQFSTTQYFFEKLLTSQCPQTQSTNAKELAAGLIDTLLQQAHQLAISTAF
jgi:hypothetical protein